MIKTLKNILKPIKGVKTIGEFFGGVAGGVGTAVAKGIGGAAIDTVVGAGKLATAPFRSDDKMIDQSKLKTEQQVQEKKEDAKQEKQTKKSNTKERKEKLDPKSKEVKFKGTSLAPDRSKAKKEATLDPAVKILMKIARTIDVIESNVSTIIEGLKAGEKDDKKLKGKEKEKAIEDARLERQDKSDSSSEPGILKKGVSKIAEKGASGIFKMIIGGIVKFFAGKFIIETFFPQFKEPIFGFFRQIGDFFLNIRDVLVAFQQKDFKLAQDELKDAGGNLKTIFKTLAKFLSNLIDSILKFMGFEELNLYEDAAKTIEETIKPKFKEFKEKVVNYFNNLVGPEGEGKSFFEKLLIAFKNLIRDLAEKISSFFTRGNITRIMADLGVVEDARDRTLRGIEQRRKIFESAKRTKQFGEEILASPEGETLMGETSLTEKELLDLLDPQRINNPKLPEDKRQAQKKLLEMINKRREKELARLMKNDIKKLDQLLNTLQDPNRDVGDIIKDVLTSSIQNNNPTRFSMQKKFEFDGNGLNAGSAVIAGYSNSVTNIDARNQSVSNQNSSSMSIQNVGEGLDRYAPSQSPVSQIS